MAPRSTLHPSELSLPVSIALCLAVLVWAYWSTLGEVAERWAHDPQYTHGYLVPFFSLFLLWRRRAQVPVSPASSWWGLALLLPGVSLWLMGAYFHYVWLDHVSFVPCVAGIFIGLGGSQAGRWAWPAIVFLTFMVPLPYRIGVAMAVPLQGFATIASTFLLQTIGLPALAEGNTILLNEARFDVVSACSGLRMLMIFFALASAVALVIQRPLWERAVVISSAVPIALFANITRISLTAILQVTMGGGAANAAFHDFAGWLMMPLALGLLALELKLLDLLFVVPTHSRGKSAPSGAGLPRPGTWTTALNERPGPRPEFT